MSKARFSAPQLERLKREAKHRRHADSSLTQAQALDQVAVDQGWPSWPLLVKHSITDIAHNVNLDCRKFQGGMPGVFEVEMNIVDEDVRNSMLRERLRFPLPQHRGWLFRGVESMQHEFGRYFDTNTTSGLFVEARWRAILSINGIQPDDVEGHVLGTRHDVLGALHLAALEALLPQLASISPTAGGQVRLFFTRPSADGVAQLGERNYDTVAEAKASVLPDGWIKVGIPRMDGSWISYQKRLGWSDDAQTQ